MSLGMFLKWTTFEMGLPEGSVEERVLHWELLKLRRAEAAMAATAEADWAMGTGTEDWPTL